MSITMDSYSRTIQPDGLPLAILTLSCVLFGLSLITVSLRSYARFVRGSFGLDDVFMLTGIAAYAAATGLSIHGIYVGLGRRDQYLNAWQESEAMKYYILWILLYVVALATVKSSICITILRIASTKRSTRMAIYVLLTITWASFCITFIGTLLYCRPINAIWMPQLVVSGSARCAPVKTLVILGHVATVSTIATDLALVIVPAFILWSTQMKKSAKLSAFGLLSFASVASIVTMVRIPYVNKFEAMRDLPFWVAHTMLCSNIEIGIGCIASSLASLRYFFRHDIGDTNKSGPSNNKRSGATKTSLYTIGRDLRLRKAGDKILLNSNVEARISLSSFHHGGLEYRWEHLRDGESEYNGNMAEGMRGGAHSVRTTKASKDSQDLEKNQSIYGLS